LLAEGEASKLAKDEDQWRSCCTSAADWESTDCAATTTTETTTTTTNKPCSRLFHRDAGLKQDRQQDSRQESGQEGKKKGGRKHTHSLQVPGSSDALRHDPTCQNSTQGLISFPISLDPTKKQTHCARAHRHSLCLSLPGD